MDTGEAGSYLRLIDSCSTHFKAQGPSRTCNESKKETRASYKHGTAHSAMLVWGVRNGIWDFGFEDWGRGLRVWCSGVGV